MNKSTILVATDFSDGAFDALEHAVGMAKLCDLRVVVMHAHHDLPAATSEASIFSSHFDVVGTESKLQHLIADKIEGMLDEIGIDDLDVEISVYPGNPVHGMLELAKRIDPAYMVVGRTGLSEVEHTLTGSSGEKLVRHAKHTVMLVGEAIQPKSKSILVPLDFGPTGKDQIEVLRRVPMAADGVIHILSVVPRPSGFWDQLTGENLTEQKLAMVRKDTRRRLDQVAELLGDLGVKVALHLREGDATHEILEVAKSTAADTILIGSIGRSGLAHLLIGNTAEKVMRHFTKRTIVVHHEDK